MSTKLYVGNLSYQISENSLGEIFGSVGEVTSVKIITDMYTGKSKGFGFVEMGSKEEATQAIEQLNGKDFEGRSLKIDHVKEIRGEKRNDRNFRDAW